MLSSFRPALLVALSLCLHGSLLGEARATVYTWQGLGNSDSWTDTNGNWAIPNYPGYQPAITTDTAVFGSPTQRHNTFIQTGIVVAGITYNAPGYSLAINSFSLTVKEGVTATYDNAPNFTVNAPLTLGGNSTVGNLSGTSTIGSDNLLAPATLNVVGPSSSFNGSFQEDISLTVGDGTHTASLTLSRPGYEANIYTGSTLVQANATLVSGAADSLGASSAHTINGMLSLASGSSTVASLSGTGTVNLNANTLTVANSGSFSGAVSGTGGSLVKAGTGTLALSGSNGYTGGTTLNAGTLRVDGYDALGTGLVTINGGTLGNVAGGNDGTDNLFTANADFAIDVQGAGNILDFFANVAMGTDRTVTFTGDGIACFEGGVSGHNITFLTGGDPATVTFCSDVSNTFTGTLRIGDGVHLELWKQGNDFDPPVIAISGDLVVDQGATAILITKEQFSATSNAEINGTLRGEASGTNTINGLTGTGTIQGINGETLAVNSGSFGGTITEDQSIIKQGAGTLTLTGSSSYTDGTTVASGTLRAANDHALGNGMVVVTGGAVLYVDAGVALDVGGSHSVTLEGNGQASYKKEFSNAESLANFRAITSSGSNATVAQILSGTAEGGKTVVSAFDVEPSTPAGNDENRISDVFSLSGMTGETFVMQLSYTQAAFDAAFTAGIYASELELRIGWLEGGVWVPVANGAFVPGAWNGSTVLGTYGVDTANNVVWAVTNHNSEFAVVPEPSIPGLLSLGLGAAFFSPKRRTSKDRPLS